MSLPKCGADFGAVASQGFRHRLDGSVCEISRDGQTRENSLNSAAAPTFNTPGLNS